MATRANVQFKIESWDEKPYAEVEGGGKLTRASVRQALSGDIEGDAAVEWLMCYRADQTADFVGLQRVTGRLGERSGSFIVRQEDGRFDGGEARARLSVVPSSGTGELAGLRGEGELVAPRGGQASFTLDYRLGD
jgi:hypothetical protein